MNWQLKKLEIEFREYGEFKGKYTGVVKFMSGDQDAFTFSLSPEETQGYLDIISNKVGLSASELGQKIVESLKWLPAGSQPVIQLSATAE